MSVLSVVLSWWLLLNVILGWWLDCRHWKRIADTHRRSAREWEDRYHEASRDFRALAAHAEKRP